MSDTASDIPDERSPALPSILIQVVLVLAAAQLVRGYTTWFLYDAVRPGLDDGRWYLVSALGFAAAAAALWLILKPRAVDLGLTWTAMTAGSRSSVMGLAVLLGAVVIYTLWASPELLPKYLYWVLLVPLFEELLFRGYLWGRIGEHLNGRWAPWLTFVAVTLLFGLWHLGYLDVLTLRVLPFGSAEISLADLLLRNVLVGWLVGALTGYARLRGGAIHGAFLLHALWNLLTA